jgi:hypothetical protein
LKLLEEIRVEWWQGLSEGWLKPWTLDRIVMPLVRACENHAEQLTAALKKEPLSTREMDTWFTHYGKAGKGTREKMARDPHMFLKALGWKKKSRPNNWPPGRKASVSKMHRPFWR